jgi:trk system potassium uptake protein TrkH
VIIGGLHLVPLLLIPFYPQDSPHAGAFLLAGLPLMVSGLLAWRLYAPKEPLSLTVQEGSVIVVVTWIIAVFAAAIPFMRIDGLTFSQAVFESTSGWTTTGLTVVDVEKTPRVLLFFRSFIQRAGGAGFAIIALSAVAGSFGTGLVAAEGRADQLAPHVRYSASIVLRIYLGYIAFGIVALRAAGMGWFDAVNHAFTAVATGGFSTKAASIGHWDSPAIEAVIIILMCLGSINFFIAYTFMRGKFREVALSGELRLMLGLIITGTLLLLSIVTIGVYPSAEKALRVAVFEVVSALSGAGFSTTTYANWMDFGLLVLILLMLIGGGTGSTAGGIKQLRIYILYKSIRWEIQRAFMPRHMVNEPVIWQGEKHALLNDAQVRQSALFIGMYLTVYLLGSGVMAAYGYSLKESMFEFASALGTVGLSVGVIQPDMPEALLWLNACAMLLGRLEIFAVIIGMLKLLGDIGTIFRRYKQSSYA